MSKGAKSPRCENCGADVPLLEENCPECGWWQDWSYYAPCPNCGSDVDHQYRQSCPFCNAVLTRWNVAIQRVLEHDYHTDVTVSKTVPDPEHAGFKEGGGKPVGQTANYRLPLSDDSEIHVKEYEDRYEVHRDKCTTDIPLGHLLQDAPVETGIATVVLYHLFSK